MVSVFSGGRSQSLVFGFIFAVAVTATQHANQVPAEFVETTESDWLALDTIIGTGDQTGKNHKMPDGSIMLDADMPAYEMQQHPGQHMMKDDLWMADEDMMHKMPDGSMMRDIGMPDWEAKHGPGVGTRLMKDGSWKKHFTADEALTGAGLLATTEDLHSKHQVEKQFVAPDIKLVQPIMVNDKAGSHVMPDGSTMLDTDMATWEMHHRPGQHMMKDGSWMKDEDMMHKMSDGSTMRDIDMPAMGSQGLLATSEDLNQKHQVEAQLLATSRQPVIVKEKAGSHVMPDGSTMLDTDMATWEMHHRPGQHMMKDGSWMKDEDMMHKMSDGSTMRDIDMPAMGSQGLLATSEDLNQKHQAEMTIQDVQDQMVQVEPMTEQDESA